MKILIKECIQDMNYLCMHLLALTSKNMQCSNGFRRAISICIAANWLSSHLEMASVTVAAVSPIQKNRLVGIKMDILRPLLIWVLPIVVNGGC